MLKIYDTQLRKKVEFKPIHAGEVRMYVCGPTVYNRIHIGNARTFISFDIIRRYLEWRGYKVTFVQNVTDVDDKIIKRASVEDRSAEEVASEYTQLFIDDMHRAGVLDPTIRPRATQEINTMIELVEHLIETGHAYESDGDVYFSVRTFDEYGKLSGRNIDDAQAGHRELRGDAATREATTKNAITKGSTTNSKLKAENNDGDSGIESSVGDSDEAESSATLKDRKRDPLDFALWKAAKPGEPAWDSPWGAGRPGWHIECSAMSHKYLGTPFDIHGGGSDLIFPHHENERAQAQAAYGCTFANHWMHSGMLQIANADTGEVEKMSKSLNNFLLLHEALDIVRPEALRMLMLQTHYRSPLVFGDARLAEADAALKRIETAVKNTDWALGHVKNSQDESGDANAGADASSSESASSTTDTPSDTKTSSGESASTSKNASSAATLEQDNNASAETDALAQDNNAPAGLGSLAHATQTARDAFTASMDDDFNAPLALGAIFTLVGELNSATSNKILTVADVPAVKSARDTIVELMACFGINVAGSTTGGTMGAIANGARGASEKANNGAGEANADEHGTNGQNANNNEADANNAGASGQCAKRGASASVGKVDTGANYPDEILELARDVAGYVGSNKAEAAQSLLDARAKARAEKNWDVADSVRDGLTDLGFKIEDTPQGARVSFEG